jgi:hypothetical protein
MQSRRRAILLAGAAAPALVATLAVAAPAAPPAVAAHAPSSAAPSSTRAARAVADRADTPASARRARIERPGRWVRERMTAGDVDWFRYRLASTTAVSVTLGGLPADYDLAVFDDTGRRRGVSTRTGRTFDEVWLRLPAGDVLVRVTRKRGATAGTYSVRLRTFSPRVHVVEVHRTPDVPSSAIGEYYNATGSWFTVTGLRVEWLDRRKRVVLRDYVGMTPDTWLRPWSRTPLLVFGGPNQEQVRRITSLRVFPELNRVDDPPKVPSLTARVTRRNAPDWYYHGTVSNRSRATARDVRVYVCDYERSYGSLQALGFSAESYTVRAGATRPWSGSPYGPPPRSPLTVVRVYQSQTS